MTETTEPARAVVTPARRIRFSWIWLVPLVAALAGASLLLRSWLSTGPTVTISFESAEGLEVGQTKIRYRDVVIGTVTDIRVAPDLRRVLVRAQLNREGSSRFTRKETRFWVVRPRVGVSGVTGLTTLLSGAYISADTAASDPGGASVYEFKGLEKPPEVTNERSGRRFILRATEIGSIEIGSPVYYRGIAVGRVIDFGFNANGRIVNVQVFIDAPNDKFVTTDSRFWNVSGVNLSLDTSGVVFKMGSVASIIAGGIAFTNVGDGPGLSVPADTSFDLKGNEAAAVADPDGDPLLVHMKFHQSIRGLKLGSIVEFRGLELGKVVDIDLEFEPKTMSFYVLVKAMLYPMRFGDAYGQMKEYEKNADYPGQLILGPLIEKGLRAQLQAANLLTGQQLIALDFFKDAPAVKFDGKSRPIEIPTTPGNFDRLQQQVGSIVAKLDAVPIQGIGTDLQASLKSLNRLLKVLNDKLSPQAASALKSAQSALDRVDGLLSPDSSGGANLNDTLRELSAAARSLRLLSDALQADPGALLRGRSADVLPAVKGNRTP